VITVDWPLRRIFVPQSYLVDLGSSLFELDVNQFRLDLKDLEDDPLEGQVYPDTHQHNTEATLSGTTFTRLVEIINGYTIEFEDTIPRVRLTGANNNILDVAIINGVSIASTNSAGLVTIPGAVAAGDLWDFNIGGQTAQQRLLQTDQNVESVLDILCNNANVVNNPDGSRTVTLFEDDGTSIRAQVLISADGLTRTRLV